VLPAPLLFPLELLGLGLGAGVLTTIAGQGGGLLLLLACSALIGPHQALALTTPALLLGNLHRALLLRRSIEWPVALRMIGGAVPGALVGGLVATVTPVWALRVLLIVMTVLAVARAGGLLRFDLPTRALLPAGAIVGAMTGTSGGAGILFAPVLLSAGLSGRVFVATSSAIAFSTHTGRMLGYASRGLFSQNLIFPTIVVTIAILFGNGLGDRLRSFLTKPSPTPLPAVRPAHEANLPTHESDRESDHKKGRGVVTFLEYGTLVVCVVLSVAGLD
jgi:uncharacterized protein